MATIINYYQINESYCTVFTQCFLSEIKTNDLTKKVVCKFRVKLKSGFCILKKRVHISPGQMAAIEQNYIPNFSTE